MGVWSNIKRNLVSVIVPTVCGLLIFADWNHTRLWKEQVAKENSQIQNQQ